MRKKYNCVHCGRLTSNITGGISKCNICRKRESKINNFWRSK